MKPEGGSRSTRTAFALYGAAASAVTIAAGVLRSKFVAAAVGPTGLGVFSETQQLVALTSSIASIAWGPALLSWAAMAGSTGDKDGASRGLSSALLIGIPISGLGGLIAMFVANSYLGAPSFPVVAFVAATVVASLGFGFVFAVTTTLGAWHFAKETARIALLSSVAGSLVTMALVVPFGLSGVFAGALVGACVGVVVALTSLRRQGFHLQLGVDRQFLRSLVQFGGVTLATTQIGQASQTGFRHLLLVNGGELGHDFNGFYQAAATVGTQYFSVAVGSFGAYYYPLFVSALSAEALSKHLEESTAMALRVAPPLLLGLIAVRHPLLIVLYSTRFSPAGALLGLHLAGDVARAIGLFQSQALQVRGRTQAVVVLETVAALCWVGLNALLIPGLGLTGVGIAYVLTQTAYLLAGHLMVWLTERTLVPIGSIVRALGFSGACCAAVFTPDDSVLWGCIVLSVAAIWAIANGTAAAVYQRVRNRLAER